LGDRELMLREEQGILPGLEQQGYRHEELVVEAMVAGCWGEGSQYY